MQYIDRKTTPLKYNWFLKFILPISFIRTVYSLYSLITALLFMNTSSSIASGLNSAGYDLSNMGIFFWPVIINVIFLVVYSILLFYASVGLWKWKSYGPKAVIFYQFLTIIQIVYMIVLVRMNPLFINVILDSYEVNEMFDTTHTLMMIYIGIFVFVSLFYAIIMICTIFYYKKRKLLFDDYYIQPQTDTFYTEPVVQQSEESVVEENREDISNFQPYYCTECGTKITDENTQYCPNCGKKLK